MTKSEKQQKQTRLYELCDKLTTALAVRSLNKADALAAVLL